MMGSLPMNSKPAEISQMNSWTEAAAHSNGCNSSRRSLIERELIHGLMEGPIHCLPGAAVIEVNG